MSRPEGLIELPDGSAIFYEDAAHAYYRARKEMTGGGPPHTYPYEWVRGKRLTGASTLAKPFNWDSGKLLAWKERMTCEGIAALFQTGDALDDSWLTSGDRIRQRLRDSALTADDVRDKKGTIGTNVHKVLEGLAGVCPMPNVDEMPDEEYGYVRAVMKWWEHHRPEVLNAEQFVYSEFHGYAGRFDLRCKFPTGVLPDWTYLIDLKTSSFISPAMHVQLQLYAIAAMECGVGYCDECLILQVKDDGTWREVPCRATELDALAAISVYRGAGRIEREAAA